jgi:signal transduction histidine kinase
MTGLLRRGGAPFFLRIFGVVLLTLLLVQVLNFAAFLLAPPPQPTITTVAHIVGLLEGTAAPDANLPVRDGAIDRPTRPTGRDEALARILAARLAINADAVRVRSRGPGSEPRGPLAMLAPGGPLAMPARPPSRPTDAELAQPDWLPAAVTDRLESRGELVLIGDFAVSARLGGRWRTVELRSSGIAPWRRDALVRLLIAMVVIAPVAWFLARSLARPIGLFADAARRLGRNPKAPPLALDGPAEIQNAASAFNEMQARLNRYVEDRTTLVAAIAHDLRTPLMRLGLRLENVPAELRTACEADIRDMEQMIAAVMAFVRDMNRPSRRQRLDLRALAQSVTDGFDDEGASVTLHDGPPLVIEGDAAALKALLVNLVGNAVKYAGGAEIALAAEENMAVIAVSDCGPGMTQEDLDRAFEPFFRAERSRNRDTGGIGLGLASVRAVARAHGGEAQLVNRPEGGLLARVTLPL